MPCFALNLERLTGRPLLMSAQMSPPEMLRR